MKFQPRFRATRFNASSGFLPVDIGKNISVACLYPFAATLAQLQAADPTITELLAVSGADNQTLTYTIKANPAANVKAAQTTNLAAAQTVDCTANVHAVEWAITSPSLPASGATLQLELLTLALTHSVVFTVIAKNNTGTPAYDYGLYVDGLNRYFVTNSVSAPTLAAITIDAAGIVALYLNGSGTPVTLSSTAVTPAAYAILGEALQSAGSAGADAGKTFVATLHSNHTAYTTPLPVGTLDVCGNTI